MALKAQTSGFVKSTGQCEHRCLHEAQHAIGDGPKTAAERFTAAHYNQARIALSSDGRDFGGGGPDIETSPHRLAAGDP